MIDIIKLAQQQNIGINITPLDGSYRPLAGRVTSIVTLSNGETRYSINVTDLTSETELQLEIDDAIRKLTYQRSTNG